MIRSKFAKLSSPLALLAVVSALPLSAAADDDGGHRFKAQLSGFQEVPPIFTEAQGRFRARLDKGSATISYELSYDDIDPTAAHIHFGQKGVNGGVIAFLCADVSALPCPPGPVTITGTIQAADVVGPAGQGIAAGDFDALLEVLREGVAYANMHTVLYPGGEARGQIRK